MANRVLSSPPIVFFFDCSPSSDCRLSDRLRRSALQPVSSTCRAGEPPPTRSFRRTHARPRTFSSGRPIIAGWRKTHHCRSTRFKNAGTLRDLPGGERPGVNSVGLTTQAQQPEKKTATWENTNNYRQKNGDWFQNMARICSGTGPSYHWRDPAGKLL